MPADVFREPTTGDWHYQGENVGPYGIRIVWRTVWPSLDADVAGVLTLARGMFAAAMAAGAAEAAFWEAGGAPRTVLTYDGKLAQPQLEELRANYVRQRQENPGQPAVLAGGLKLESFGSDLASSGAGEAAARVGAAVARYFGVPPHLANVPNYSTSLTYINTESAGIDFVRYTLSAYAGAIGDALSEELPGDYLMGRQVRLDLSALTVPEAESQARIDQMSLDKWMTREEIRKRHGLPPVPLLGSFAEPAPEAPPDAAPAPLQLVEGIA
jgi:HK97 family phage portal protein